MTRTRKKLPLKPNPPSPLKAARVLRGWTLDQVAERVGISKATLYRYEAGTFSPPLKSAQRLAELYGATVDELWPGEAAA